MATTQVHKMNGSSGKIIEIPVTKGMPDYGNALEDRGIPLHRVGVRGVDFPLNILQKVGGHQQVAARFDMFSGIPAEQKGTHMSRFSETLMDWVGKPLSGHNFKDLVFDLKGRLKNEDIYISAEFTYFVPKLSPATQLKSIMAYKCKFIGHTYNGEDFNFIEQVMVPVQLLCPCSKELAIVDSVTGVGKGAHNQRAEILVQLKVDQQPGPWIEDIVSSVEAQGSVPLFPLLKREDERYVTIHGYEHPKFVEDAARDVALVLQLPNVNWFKIRVESQESIHAYSAVAYAGRTKTDGVWGPSHAGFF